MIYGATGAIGSSDVQFLKYYCVYVTAVCGGENAELVRSLGADKVIDYKTQNFTKDEEQYDYVFDAVDKTGFLQCKQLLKMKGIYTSSGDLRICSGHLFSKCRAEKSFIHCSEKHQGKSWFYQKAN
jgi:NADPH:quinone reductase-like Zn-dependent oxidoreductase